MSGLTRALKYATFRAGRVILITLLMSIGFVFYLAFLDGAEFTLENLITRYPLMLILIGNLMFMLYGMLDVATYMQLTLSYGSTRRDAAISTYYMQIIQMAAILAIMALFYAVVPDHWIQNDGKMICLLALVLFLFGSGFALISGVLIHRFGKAAYIIIVVFCTFGGGIFGGLVGFHGSTEFLEKYLDVLLNMAVLNAVGAVWYAAAVVIFWFCIRKIEVRV